MRCIIREQPYEKLLAAGHFRYQKDGEPTGVEEVWRLTELIEGYRNLRIEIDARNSIGGETTLYHLVINPSGQPERLKMRQFGSGSAMSGDVHLEANTLVIYSDIDGKRFEHELAPPEGYLFVVPSVIWFGFLLAGNHSQQDVPAASFSQEYDLQPLESTIKLSRQGKKKVNVSGFDIDVRTFQVDWLGQRCHLYVDQYDCIVEALYGDGLIAKETKYIRHLKYR
jgi:hypothetical protein